MIMFDKDNNESRKLVANDDADRFRGSRRRIATVDEWIPEGASKVESVLEAKSETIFGLVANCGSLNVRSQPRSNADVLCTIPCNSEVEILDDCNGYYSVITSSGVEGYCVKDYIVIRK